MRLWSLCSLKAFGVTVTLIDEGNEQLGKGCQYIWTGNHRSWIDHFCIFKFSLNPTHIFLNEKFAKIFLFGRTCLLSGSIPVDKGSLSRLSKIKVSKGLKKGRSLCLFFEGTRGKGKTLLPFKKGAFHFSKKFGVPLKPFFLFNTENVVSKHRSFFDVKPQEVILVLDQSWTFHDESFEEEFERFKAYYVKRYEELYQRYNRNP